MHKILFRGKPKNELIDWVYGYYFYSELTCKHCIMGESKDYGYNCIEVIPETVGQYTGLKDKNGTKIFEGDITKHRSNYSGNDVVAVITYTDGCFLAMADKDSGFNISDKLEVIGNIHDNPELLNGE
jgi:uncharacterized phage protein (TIGR01671 family)